MTDERKMAKVLPFPDRGPVNYGKPGEGELVPFSMRIGGQDVTAHVRSCEVEFEDGGRVQLYPPEAG